MQLLMLPKRHLFLLLLRSKALTASGPLKLGFLALRLTNAAIGRGEAAANVAADTITADQQISDRAELARVQTAIATLPQAIREPLVLRTIEGMTQAEAAQVLGISEKAVETRLYRARGQLSELLRV